MFPFTTKTTLPTRDQALKGRETPLAVPERHHVNGHRLQPPFHAGLEQAVFALGCFWGAERKFWNVKGVYSTAVGYAGGHTPNPTYDEVCTGKTGHTEAVLVVYDPKVVTFDALLKVFWESHDPTQGMRQGNDVGTQYRSAVFASMTRSSKRRRHHAMPTSVLWRAGLRCHHDRDPDGTAVLLCRRLSPAVSRQESGWLLRSGRDGGGLPVWAGRRDGRVGRILYPRGGMWDGALMSTARVASVLVAAALTAACTQPPRKPVDSAAATPPPSAAEPARIGTVGLVRELKDRGMSTQNWAGVIGSIFTNETESDVIRVRYEVTVFFRDGTQGVVIVDQRPAVRSGQRVRVTGDRIEPLEP